MSVSGSTTSSSFLQRLLPRCLGGGESSPDKVDVSVFAAVSKAIPVPVNRERSDSKTSSEGGGSVVGSPRTDDYFLSQVGLNGVRAKEVVSPDKLKSTEQLQRKSLPDTQQRRPASVKKSFISSIFSCFFAPVVWLYGLFFSKKPEPVSDRMKGCLGALLQKDLVSPITYELVWAGFYAICKKDKDHQAAKDIKAILLSNDTAKSELINYVERQRTSVNDGCSPQDGSDRSQTDFLTDKMVLFFQEIYGEEYPSEPGSVDKNTKAKISEAVFNQLQAVVSNYIPAV
ncbi:MAG: hypothetical protein V4591_03905 [Bdellovibrionota bacterium]